MRVVDRIEAELFENMAFGLLGLRKERKEGKEDAE
jgi:hypothetical protein